jgi:hypothetical protein
VGDRCVCVEWNKIGREVMRSQKGSKHTTTIPPHPSCSCFFPPFLLALELVPSINALVSAHVPALGKHIAQKTHCATASGRRSWVIVVIGWTTSDRKRRT